MSRLVRAAAVAAAGAAVLLVGAPAASATEICPLGLVLDTYPAWTCVDVGD